MYLGLDVKYRYSCRILMKLEFSGQILEKYSNIKFHENPLNASHACSMRTYGQTDRYDEADSRFTQFFERS